MHIELVVGFADRGNTLLLSRQHGGDFVFCVDTRVAYSLKVCLALGLAPHGTPASVQRITCRTLIIAQRLSAESGAFAHNEEVAHWTFGGFYHFLGRERGQRTLQHVQTEASTNDKFTVAFAEGEATANADAGAAASTAATLCGGGRDGDIAGGDTNGGPHEVASLGGSTDADQTN